jgi:hypothetical protein
MKILFVNSIHHKNYHSLINYKNINLTIVNSINDIYSYNFNDYDCVYSPSHPIDVSKYPNTKFIFGPHFSVFPNPAQVSLIKGKNSVYIQPSSWVIDFWKKNSICQDLNMKASPFGVDTEKFKSNISKESRNKVFIYYKRRLPHELDFIKTFLTKNNIEFKTFSYTETYNENDYIEYLKYSKYGIWVGANESQGFALEEALSLDVPLLVWNVTSLTQEYGSGLPDIPATTIPYWNEKCGEYFYNINEFESTFNKFILNLNNYKPREYIVENIDLNNCEKKLIDIIKNI